MNYEDNSDTTEAKVFKTEDLPTFEPLALENAAETADNTEEQVIQTDPKRYVLDEVGEFVTLQLAQGHNGEIEMGIVNYPIPLDMVRRFQAQLGEQMAEENMKLVIHKGRVYLAPIQTSRIITLNP